MANNFSGAVWFTYLALIVDLIMLLTRHLSYYLAIILAIVITAIIYYLKEIRHMS